MSNIVSIINDQAVTTSTTIADGVKRLHKHVIRLIRDHSTDLEEFGRISFKTVPFETAGGVQHHEIALLNEQQATLLITFMRNIGIVKEFKVRLIQAFFEMRDKLNNKPVSTSINLDDPEFIANLIGQSAKKLQALSEEKLQLEHKVEEDAPKVAFHDRVVNAYDAISISQAAKILGTGRRRLFAYLRQLGWVTRKNEPYQAKIESGYMDVKLGSWQHPDHGIQQSVTALVTGKGLAKLQKLFH